MKSEIETQAAAWFSRRDAGLSATETQALAQWLAVDPRHRVALAKLEGAWDAFGRPARSGSSDALLEELTLRRGRRQRRRRAALSAAALLVVGFTAWLGLKSQPIGPSAPIVLIHQPNERKLVDGSIVVLRDGAEIDVQFTKEARRVHLVKGEAMFEVAKDAARPFIVRANGIDVRAVGTAFAVQLNSGAVDVLVAEGTVSVAAASLAPAPETPTISPANSESPKSAGHVLVTAGNRVLVEPAAAVIPTQPESVPAAEIDRRLNWRAPRVEFNGLPLADAVALLNREAEGRTPVRLRIADRELGAVRVSGMFRTDNVDSFVFVLETSFGVKAERSEQWVVLRKAAP